MKLVKKLKKLSIFSLILTALFSLNATGVLADAKPEFNTSSDDQPLIRVKNITQSEADYKPSTSAKIGDTVRIHLWVHNNVENSTATNVLARASLPTDYSKSHTLTAHLSSDNADSISGTALVSLDELGRLEPISGTTLVYSDVYGSGYKWPNDNISSSGINLGSVKGCWPYVVQITFEAKVKAKPVEEEKEPHLVINKQVSYGSERDNGRWYDSISKDTKVFGPGEFFYYHIILENTGNAAVTDIVLEDRLPSYIKWTGGSGEYKSDTRIVKLSIGDLAKGAKKVVEYQVRVEETLPNGNRTQENVVVVRSSNYSDLSDSTVVWIKGPQIIEEVKIVETRVEKVEKEVVETLPETGSSMAIANILFAIGSLITGFGLKKLEK